ncbi:hypothetical protein KUCAC02_022015, partial [Chaenocephalus aceratus]
CKADEWGQLADGLSGGALQGSAAPQRPACSHGGDVAKDTSLDRRHHTEAKPRGGRRASSCSAARGAECWRNSLAPPSGSDPSTGCS